MKSTSNHTLRVFLLITTLLSLHLAEKPLYAQPIELPAPLRLTEREGLPQAFVSAIVQDQQGFIWVGTRDGLCRYDGQQFKVFQPDPDGRPSLSYAGIGNLTLDHHGRIWIMSEEGDLDIFYPKTETFVNLSRQPGYEKAMRGRELSFFRYDHQERLWLVPLDAAEVIRYDFKNQGVKGGPAELPSAKGGPAKRFFFKKNNDRNAAPSDTIADIAEAADGRIWLSTTTGLKYLDPANDRFQNHPTTIGTTTPDVATSEGFPLRLYARPNGDLLLLYQYRLVCLRTDTGQAESYYLPVDGSSLQNWNFVTDPQGRVYFNHQGRMFGFTDREGVRILARQPLERIEEHGSRLWLDRSGVLWEGTRGAGIRKYDLTPNPFRATPYRHSFRADLRRELGLEDLGTAPPSPLDPSSGLSSYQFRYAVDGQQALWFNVGSSDIWQLDTRTGQLTARPLPVSFHNLFIDNIPCPLATGPDGEVWAVHDSLAWHYDLAAKSWVEFPHRIPRARTGDVTMLTVDRQTLWLATRQKGLWRLDRQTGQLRPYRNVAGDARSLSNDALLSLSEDPTDPNRLWVGTFGGGLCAFDKRTGYFRRFTVADGLPNNVIYSVIPDAQGYLWMGTNKGLCRLDRRSFETTTYTQEHGLLANEFNRFHWLKLPDRRIIMGGLEGITSFYPAEVGQDDYDPPVELTALLVNNQPAAASLTASLPPQAVQRLTLAHDQNFITAEFAALQFNGSADRNAGSRSPDNNRYRYRLEGLEDDWKESPRPVATYTDLAPGDYVLLLNATNTSGKWSRHVRRLAISIRPPVWATWWAYLLYILTVAGLAWAGLRFYLWRIKLRQRVALREQEAEQLRAVDEMKSDFFANMTHEFRTPLTLILAPTEQLQREQPDPKNYQRHLSTIARNAHRLLGLVDQLLDFSKLEAGALPVVEVRGDLQAFVARTVDLFRELARERKIELLFAQKNLAEAYWFDADKLERILYNLLANALKYTEQGSVVVTLSGVEDGVKILVKDTGPGIASDQLPHLFDRYYRAPPRRAENNGQRDKPATGTGLGLALVKELVDLQHGRVSVSSEPGSGTTFVVELPYRSAANLSDEAAPNPNGVVVADSVADATPAELPSADTPLGGVPLVLVVEDNDELASYIAESLPADYRLLRANDGQAGWELALAELPDLILSDVMMPVMDGYALCQKIKTDLRTSHIPVLLLTGKVSPDNRIEGLSLGADDYLAKPFHVAELLLRVRNQLAQKQRLRQQLRAELSQPSGPTEAGPATEDPFLRQLYALLDNHLDNDQLSIEQLIDWLNMSRMTFYRKLNALTDLTPAELIRLHRLKRATQYLRQGVSVAETAHRVGFKTTSHFSRVFRAQYQVTPAKFARQEG